MSSLNKSSNDIHLPTRVSESDRKKLPETGESSSVVDVEIVPVPDPRVASRLSVLEAARTWPFAILWAGCFSTTLILVSYSPAWINQLFAVPAFTSRFGYEYEGAYVISAKWQSALSACSMLGQVIGAPIVAPLMDRYGRKPTFMMALLFEAATIFIQFFARSLSVLVAGSLLVGVSLGCFGVISLTYAMEISPLELRGPLGGFYSFGIIMGPLVSVVVAQATLSMTSEWAYRIGFAVQWVWPLVLLPAIFFAPESPVWLIRQGRPTEAKAALQQLATRGFNVNPSLTHITEIDQQEQQLEESTNYKEIFKGTNLRRTIIATVCYSTIITTGNTLSNGGAYYMILAGIDANTGFFWSLACTLAAFVSAFVAIWILAKCLRRPIYIWSQALSALSLLLVGFIQIDPHYYESNKSAFAQGAFFVIWNLFYGAVIGPISTVIMGEVPTNALRSKTVAFATTIQVIATLLTLTIHPYFISPDSAHLQGYTGFIAGGSGVIFTIWIFFYVPETSLPTETLDSLFQSEVTARHFTTYNVTELEGQKSSIGR